MSNAKILHHVNFLVKIFSQSSNLLNQARLKVLQAQQQHIQNLLTETKERLGKASADSSSYSRVLRDLIIQALFQVFNIIILAD